MTSDKLSYEQCTDILDRFKNWNKGQKSCSYAFGGTRTSEDDIHDASRELILKATRRLSELAGEK